MNHRSANAKPGSRGYAIASLILSAAPLVVAPLANGCSECVSEIGFLCGPLEEFDGDYSAERIARINAEDLVIYVKRPTGKPNGAVVLVAHPSSDDSKQAAWYSVREWGAFLSPLGYTVAAHAYREEDSGYGELDVPDTLDAIDWLRGEGAQKLGLNRVFLAGSSRGGIIAQQVAFQVPPGVLAGIVADRGVTDFVRLNDRRILYLAGLFGQTVKAAVQQTIDWLGVLPEDDPGPWLAISSINYVADIDTPMLVMHGTGDTVIPFEQAAAFKDAAEAAGRTNIEFYLHSATDHITLGFQPEFRWVIIDFLNRNR